MQLVPYFQPIIDMSTAKVVGHEALARMIDHDGNVKSAWQIFSDKTLDEQHVLAFDRAVRLQALERFAEAGQPGFLTINISPRWIELLQDDWIPTVEMMDMFGIAPEKLVVEIVETQADPDKLHSIVRAYKDLGIKVAVDDFGAGFSRFDRVIRLEPDIIKLDMRFFKEAVRGGSAQNILESLSYMADRMGSQVLCEGVEEFNELQFALEIGSKLIQGFMFSEAQSSFTDSHAFADTISSQRERFLHAEMQKEEQIVAQSRQVHKEVEALSDQLAKNHGYIDIDTLNVDTSQIVSMFICDLSGNQISPNFKVSDGQWFEIDGGQGTNWCWRPYFYQLLSNAQMMKRRSVTSRTYRDPESGMMIKTIARFVGEDKILMVDIKKTRGYSIH